MKFCSNTTCDQQNPQELTNFYKRSDTKRGLYSRCKNCCYTADQKRKDKITKYKKKYQILNPNKSAEYYKNNKEGILKKMRERNSTPEGKLKVKNNNLKKFYNITLEQYNQMLAFQNDKCAICKIHRSLAGKKGLFVDHNHKNNQIRGLLCSKCNFLIGLSQEDVKILSEAIQYLENFN